MPNTNSAHFENWMKSNENDIKLILSIYKENCSKYLNLNPSLYETEEFKLLFYKLLYKNSVTNK